ncbi:MAG: glycosyltransferase family 4 protein [Bacteroidota bacterium]|nr:glycosyltransferase family 4 protein [Bacteroidota bacterium]
MNIAFSFFSNDKTNEANEFIFETFQRILRSHSDHTFILISNKSFSQSFVFSKNIIPVIINYPAKSPKKWLIWYNFKIPKILKKYEADIFISENFCTLFTKIPQLLIAPDLSFIHQPSFFTKTEKFFYKKFMPLFLKKAKTIISFSEFEKRDIVRQYKMDANKIKVIHEGIDKSYYPFNLEEREIIKEKYADGNEYFVYTGIISSQKNLKNLLKAFSIFKKRQRSSMQMIIAGKQGKHFEEFNKSLENYKFKKEIKLLNDLSEQEIIKIIASSYATLFPPVYEISAIGLLKAMKCEVPVIASEIGFMREICGDAALYFDPENDKDIAWKMMLVFKDEKLRKEFIEKGKERIKNYDWDKSASLFYKNIEDALLL